MKDWVSYKNGNYRVFLDLASGTKIRANDLDELIPDTVESMDIKITNQCDMNCKCCHENSTLDGKHADLMSESFIDKLHPYTELAIGGGNPLSHPNLLEFLEKCKRLKLIPSMTVNKVHFLKDYNFIKKLVDDKLIYGLGVSWSGECDDNFISKIQTIPNAVLHVINGLINTESLKYIKDKNIKVLILGYKRFRRGETLYEQLGESIKKKIKETDELLPTIIKEHWFKTLSFDNLALTQLDVKSQMTEEEWQMFFMGDDGVDGMATSCSMYVDMVEKKFAVNSCSADRYELMETIEDMYSFIQNKFNNK